STSILTELSWLTEKVESLLPSLFGSLPPFPDLGVDQPLAALVGDMAAAMGDVGTFGPDVMAAGLKSWIDSIAALNGANIDPVLDVLSNHCKALLKDLDA